MIRDENASPLVLPLVGGEKKVCRHPVKRSFFLRSCVSRFPGIALCKRRFSLRKNPFSYRGQANAPRTRAPPTPRAPPI
jgi:hypothetical protein